MHMSDALVSPPVFAVTGVISLSLLGVAVRNVKHRSGSGHEPDHRNEHIVPLMGVMGAFIFAAQMINFSIPGTGSSGHLVGGILLSAILGPWAALITLASVLVIQCLAFADGGFMALGCNIFNMAVLSCLVAYPLIYKPLMKRNASPGRILATSLLASIIGLELGALAVTLETEASGITVLPAGRFLLFMLPIHLLIGIGEGLATAAVIYVIQKYKPELLVSVRERKTTGKGKLGKALAAIALSALLIGGSFSWVASSDPDGLEWSIARTSGGSDMETAPGKLHQTAAGIQESTAIMPDYGTSFAGIVGSGAILLVAFGASCLLRAGQKQP